jgi:hypothetical protein
MTDPRIEALIGDSLYTCGGECALSRNAHVHFPGGWSAFLTALTAAIAEPLPPQEPAPDPLEGLTQAWAQCYKAVLAEIPEAARAPEVLIEAGRLALAMARGSPIG